MAFIKTNSYRLRLGSGWLVILPLIAWLFAACGEIGSTPVTVPTAPPAQAAPTLAPSPLPTEPPTALPTETPTEVPTEMSTPLPTEPPSALPTEGPTKTPTEVPTEAPTPLPTEPPPTRVETPTPEGTSPAGKTTVLAEGQVSRDEIDEFTLCAMGRGPKCTMKPAIARGLFETGLRPRFPDNAECRVIDEKWAISYTAKRNREAYHGGIDMPAPWGTPMIAAADGTVIGKFLGENTPRGIEIVLRHSPQETGLPVWTYTQYTHFSKMPKQEVGQRVRMGEVLGPTGNTGINVRTGRQSETRRPAIHFGVFFNTTGQYAVHRDKIIPAEGRWMDPNAMYRGKPPFDSKSLKALPREEKKIPISVMFEDGTTYPANTIIVWPYTCEHHPGSPTATPAPTPVPRPTATPTPIPTPLPPVVSHLPGGDIEVTVYRPDLVYPGNTIFADTRIASSPFLVEVDISGNVVWQYQIPFNIVSESRPSSGLDLEQLPNGNILFTLPFKGVFEVSRNKQIVWSYLDVRVSHDADRLPNGNTLMVWGWDENKLDAQVKEVDANGQLVWSWHAADYLKEEGRRTGQDGFSHTNGVVRLDNGNTLISIRNFDLLVEVDPSGEIVWSLAGNVKDPHDPEVLPNGNILVSGKVGHGKKSMEITPDGRVVWRYERPDFQVLRYNHVLPNGNIIMTSQTKIVEINRNGDVLWQLEMEPTERALRPMYKAERLEK